MSAYPISLTFTSLGSGQTATQPFPIHGKIVGITTSFQGASANANIQFNVILSSVSITDGFLNAAVFSNLVVPVLVPDYERTLAVEGAGTIIAQNQSAATAYTFTITLLVK